MLHITGHNFGPTQHFLRYLNTTEKMSAHSIHSAVYTASHFYGADISTYSATLQKAELFSVETK